MSGHVRVQYVRTYCRLPSRGHVSPGVTPHGRSASDRATPLRCRVALGEQVPKEDALEAFHRVGTTLRLRHENGALERADDEACELLYVGIGGQLARIDRCFQAVGYGCLVLREHRRDTSANRVALFARFRAEVSVQTSSTHVLLAKVLELPVDPRAQPTRSEEHTSELQSRGHL